MARIMVSGSSGFIGSHVVDRYVELGHDVTGVDLHSPNPKFANPRARYITANLITLTDNLLLPLVSGFDVINHHAAQVDVRKSIQSPSQDIEANILTTVRLAEACVKMNVKRFIFASSGGAIADSEYPESPYGIAKLSTEKYLSFFSNHHKLETIILRYANAYGPRQSAGVIPIFIQKMLLNHPVTINGGEQTRDFVYVSDVATANQIALTVSAQLNFKNNIYTICSGSSISIDDIANQLKSLCNSKSELIRNSLIQGEVLSSTLTPSNLKDFSIVTSLEDGLKLTIDSFK